MEKGQLILHNRLKHELTKSAAMMQALRSSDEHAADSTSSSSSSRWKSQRRRTSSSCTATTSAIFDCHKELAADYMVEFEEADDPRVQALKTTKQQIHNASPASDSVADHKIARTQKLIRFMAWAYCFVNVATYAVLLVLTLVIRDSVVNTFAFDYTLVSVSGKLHFIKETLITSLRVATYSSQSFGCVAATHSSQLN
jgi:hypothetical protein